MKPWQLRLMETVLGSQTPLQSCFCQSQKHELYLMYVLFFILTSQKKTLSFTALEREFLSLSPTLLQGRTDTLSQLVYSI